MALDFSFFDNSLLLGGSYSYVEGLQHTANNPYNLTYIGGDLIAPPKFTAHVTVKPTDRLTTSIRNLRVGDRKRFAPTKKNDGTYIYRHRQVPVTSYGVVNVSANYRATEKLSLSLGINNLFNHYYLPARAQWSSPLLTFNSAGQGINSRFSLTYNF